MSLSFTRRQFAAGLAAPALASARAAVSKPNILFLMADQHRGDCLGADGHAVIETPNLDRIAREGVHFRRAYSCTPTCTPARAALLTGLGPWRNGMLGYGRVAESYPVEMPRALRNAGYYTFGIGKMHWTPQRNLHGFHSTLLDESGRAESPDFRSDYRAWFATEAPMLNPDATGLGFNDYPARPYVLPERLHPTRWTGDAAVHFIEGYQRPDPFFLKVSFARPHSPYDPPPRWFNRFAEKKLPEAQVGKWAARYAKKSGEVTDLWHGDLGAAQVRQSRQGYYGSIGFIDEQVGRILDALEKRNLLDQTLIVFTADHGDMTGDHNLWRKSYAYEPSARIPMLMRWPGGLVARDRGQVSERPVEIRDILPTFLDAAGAAGSQPIELDGRSMLDIARGRDEGWREWIDLEHDVCYAPENHWNALTDGRRKYIYHAQAGEEQLFDLESDPHELNDLAGDTARTAELRTWRGRMVGHLAPRGPKWVAEGKLVARPKSILYSENYPRPKAL
jgi:arylsulfatase